LPVLNQDTPARTLDAGRVTLTARGWAEIGRTPPRADDAVRFALTDAGRDALCRPETPARRRRTR
jgi:hypothetical protein